MASAKPSWTPPPSPERAGRPLAARLLPCAALAALLPLAAPGDAPVMFEAEFLETAAFDPQLLDAAHGKDFAAVAAELRAAGLAVLRGLTAVCHEPGEGATEVLRSALPAVGAGLRQPAHDAVDRLCEAGAPASAVALIAAIESRATLERAVTTQCRTFVDGAESTGQCSQLLDVAFICANSLAELSQRSQIALLWTLSPKPDDRADETFAAWTFHEDIGRTRGAVVAALLEERLAEVDADAAGGDRTLLMAEVGVWKARLSEELLARFPTLRMLLVDPYHLRVGGAVGGASGPQGYNASEMDRAIERTQPYRDRATFMMQGSVEAAAWITPGSLDHVFVDGDHSLEGAHGDIKAWWPALRPGGVLSGHDYTLPWPGVVKAVNDFAFKEGLVVHFSPEVWWITKPAPTVGSLAGVPRAGSSSRSRRGSCVREGPERPTG